MKKLAPIVSTDSVESRILTIRGQKVILDADLAAIYGVTTKRLNEQVKRNAKRFPPDFLFQLTRDESEAAAHSRSKIAALNGGTNRSQIATGSQKHRDPRFLPYAFTENGAVMAANVLNSPQAVRMSVFVVRAFVRMRDLLTGGSHELIAALQKLEARLAELDARVGTHDGQLATIIDAIRRLAAPDGPRHRRKIGFHQAEIPRPPN